MSEWIPPGHRPHDGHPDDDVRWCECSGRCTQDAPCDCCELAELRAEVERLTAKVEQVKQASAELVAERDRRIAGAIVSDEAVRAFGLAWGQADSRLSLRPGDRRRAGLAAVAKIVQQAMQD